MAFASLGARTPFVTSTPSNAVTFASPGVAAKFGLAAAGVASAVAFVEFSFVVFASLLPAMTGKTVMASTNRLDIHTFRFNIDALSLFSAQLSLGTTRGANVTYLRKRCQDDCIRSHAVPVRSRPAQHRDRKATLFFGNDNAGHRSP